MVFRVLHHGNCFDGACSAAVFTKFHRECIGGVDSYEYRGLQHVAGGGLAADAFGAGENAIVDFKYSTSPKLTWWFDHHQSAFASGADRAFFEAGQAGELAMRQFFDPTYVSCTSFISSIASLKFGFDTAGLTDLLYWADIIDGARFESAQAAVEMRAPAMKLAMVIEQAAPEIISRIIPQLTEKTFGEVLAEPFVQELVTPLVARHEAAIELVREHAQLEVGVIYFDLTDQSIEGLSKFIPYSFFPQATYTVALTRSSFRTKISVGTNPWTTVPVEWLLNLAEICERYGGGGHARVGAISFGPEESTKARETAAVIVQQLRGAERLRAALPLS